MVDPTGLSASRGVDNPIEVNIPDVEDNKTFAYGDPSQAGDYSRGTFDRMTADRPVFHQSAKGMPASHESASALSEIASIGKDMPGAEAGGGLLDSGLQAGMVGGAVANMESGSAIRTDGSGSAMGTPGGKCSSCEGGRGYQAAYIGISLARVALGPAVAAWQELRATAQLYHFTSRAGAAAIAESGQILEGSGLYGQGVYLTIFHSRALARLQGAASAEVAIPVDTFGRPVVPTLFPGTFRHLGNLPVSK